jgi:hypothetical protein
VGQERDGLCLRVVLREGAGDAPARLRACARAWRSWASRGPPCA